MNYPEYVKVNDKEYKINTDFRIAIKCNEIAQNENIKDYERAFAIIYLLFGEEALNDGKEKQEIYMQFMKLALKFLSCGNEKTSNEKIDMDFIEDYAYIKTSFRSDYNINLDNEYMHWWEFFDLLNGLSNSEMGNCCILNRVRNLRNYDVSQIKDQKERQKIIKAKEQVALKKNKIKSHATEKQKESARKFIEALGLKGSD